MEWVCCVVLSQWRPLKSVFLDSADSGFCWILAVAIRGFQIVNFAREVKVLLSLSLSLSLLPLSLYTPSLFPALTTVRVQAERRSIEWSVYFAVGIEGEVAQIQNFAFCFCFLYWPLSFNICCHLHGLEHMPSENVCVRTFKVCSRTWLFGWFYYFLDAKFCAFNIRIQEMWWEW